MTAGSKIEWTDATWNPVRGCTRKSPGCGGPGRQGGCYAERMAARFSKPGQWGHGFAEMRNGVARWTGKIELIPAQLDLPQRWKTPRDIFVNSTSDLFHETLPDAAIDQVFAVIGTVRRHRYQILTKRPDRARDYLADRDPRLFSNVLIGCSVENQEWADIRRTAMATLAARGWRSFVSYEPALGPVDWAGWEFLAWLISGGESGPDARPSHPDWHRAARDHGARFGIPYFFKQWGEWANADDYVRRCAQGTWEISGQPVSLPLNYDVAAAIARSFGCRFEHLSTGETLLHVGKRAGGRLLDGVEHNGMPA